MKGTYINGRGKERNLIFWLQTPCPCFILPQFLGSVRKSITTKPPKQIHEVSWTAFTPVNILGHLSSLTTTKIDQVQLRDLQCNELCKTENHINKNPCARIDSTIPSGTSCHLWLRSNNYPALQQSIKPLAPWTCYFLTLFSVLEISKLYRSPTNFFFKVL